MSSCLSENSFPHLKPGKLGEILTDFRATKTHCPIPLLAKRGFNCPLFFFRQAARHLLFNRGFYDNTEVHSGKSPAVAGTSFILQIYDTIEK
jgi:hypothetical protein